MFAVPQTEQIEKRMEELRQAESAATERIRQAVDDLKLKMEADQNLTSLVRYLFLGGLSKELGRLALKEGRPY
ncbi:MAG: hypothetical protein HYS88_00645 [Candidatus Colwellbacteria bacterium]|nr:hypothetical protein [Candidatus Colwellbacteria bacterium]